MEELVCQLRQQYPAWGGRKLHHRLVRDGHQAVPAASTITGILRRNGLLDPERRTVRDWQRFEAEAPNLLWQMDFKGHFPTRQGDCHPLTITDDHSRFNLCLQACSNEQTETVQHHLSRVFACHGLPERMLMDNGSPWGNDWAHPYTHLSAWLIRQGITVLHGRPRHPQTQGKEERFHGSLVREVLARVEVWQSFSEVQDAFDAWRQVYNHRRPHEALAYEEPACRYVSSPRRFVAEPRPIVYEVGDQVRKVQDKGRISFRGREFLVSRAFTGEPVALREEGDGLWGVYYCHQRVTQLDLTCPPEGRQV
jgi:transposase InsO family protein